MSDTKKQFNNNNNILIFTKNINQKYIIYYSRYTTHNTIINNPLEVHVEELDKFL